MNSLEFRTIVAATLGKADLSHDDLQDDFILNSIAGNEDTDETINPIIMRTSLNAMQVKLYACIQVLDEAIQSRKMKGLIIEMAKVIRYLDEEGAYPQYWLNDGNGEQSEYCPALEQLEIKS